MERHEQLSRLNLAWLTAVDLITEFGEDSEMAVDAARLQAAVEHIETLLEAHVSR